MLGYRKGKRFPWDRCPFGRHHRQAEARGGHTSAQAADAVDPEQSERVMSQEAHHDVMLNSQPREAGV